ncbi:MAG TPA: flagellin [Terracidiphilus sp.]|jgi:flagellin|nr:flagellin [Terracidiphilus sp.]
MALGVLNNLSAIYAENNLNNTNSSLQTVLQQLSSGSRINSGADDAAGLSLVNGLEANSTALTQSATNATEGAGLLQVADGALSQVTNLLDRAVTLATEASNGTLNATQLSAANQEYQSILAEINNIGSTTTYNQQQVFAGGQTAIYTGDSSLAGASVDMLSIRTLSSGSVGDTAGAMSYTNGQNNVFIDLSTAGHYAQTTDSLAAAGSTSLQVAYLIAGTNTVANATITVTGANNTAQGLINAINNADLGITASFGTAATAGASAIAAVGGAANESETGIVISGNVDAGSAPTPGGYHVGVSQDQTNAATDLVYDSSVGQSFVPGVGVPSTAAQTTFTQDLNAVGIATISYQDAAGQSLSGTDLTSQINAQIALNDLNIAISDVASQDGYIGAQINTLNSISQIMSTQKENVVSAQNAIQATDYASATSNMSKYEILSQTGIAALAQANSVEQEVTKLLQ